MSVTIKDIAKEAGVSTAAVSKALNNKGGTSLALKRKIEKITQRLGYFPYIKSRQTGMFAGSSKYIGIIISYAGEHLVKNIQNGFDSVLTDSGFQQLRYNINTPGQVYDEQRKDVFVDKIIQDKSIAGFISVFLRISDGVIAKLHKNGVHVVMLNNFSSYGKCVVIDDMAAAYQAVKALIKLGRKKIGLIMPEETIEYLWELRLQGYRKALSEARIPYDPYLLVYEHSFDFKEAAYATKTLLEREPGIDAILYGSDLQAYGGMEALKIMNKNIPDDIAIMGFDDIPFSRMTNPPLSSVQQPMFEMGKTAANMLIEAINKKSFSHKCVKLKSKIILRQSSHKNIPKEKLI